MHFIFLCFIFVLYGCLSRVPKTRREISVFAFPSIYFSNASNDALFFSKYISSLYKLKVFLSLAFIFAAVAKYGGVTWSFYFGGPFGIVSSCV